MENKNVRKVLLFYNPYSGNETFRHYLDILIGKYQRAGLLTIPVRSSRHIDIAEYLKNFDKSEFDHVAVAGGDGTINIFVNALLKDGWDLPLAIYPTGTANGFASYLDLPEDVSRMADTVLNERNIQTVDLGLCNGRYFVNAAAVGSLVSAGQKADPNLKNTLGVFTYYLWSLFEVRKAKPIEVSIKFDGKEIKDDMFFMVAMNGPGVGGFKKVAPEAKLDDGMLDVVLFRNMPTAKMGGLLLQVLKGKEPKDDGIMYFKTSHLRLEAEDFVATDLDGELGEGLPMDISIAPKSLKVFLTKQGLAPVKEKPSILPVPVPAGFGLIKVKDSKEKK